MTDATVRKTRIKKTSLDIPIPNFGKGRRVAYIRVSGTDRNTARQFDGLEFDRTFIDMACGKDTHRPTFNEILNFVRQGDTVTLRSELMTVPV